ncbi:DUF368 domain-containing protein [Roseibacillus ishigakijimensis]|uniref:DUF368 domain-containing protein n=1 Tax=Roseibacillus ishigakijimensis TaxID=454146 RepID=A0A934VG95_9BACT|nr:DUF368 domain-containing protein [Roseibacillus ishigakijimensis]MBK1832608.1 DUF368 domain-containing protein [Roseibacillus ishigakijimensis]
MREFVMTALKGFAMGAANVIPGVSGGTIAFITGIYERLISALKNFDVATVRLLLQGKLAEAAAKVDLLFLLALGVGAVVSIVTLAKVLGWGFANHPVLVWAFFFGLIAASIPLVGKMVTRWSPLVIVLGVVGCALAVSLVFLTPAQESTHPVYLGLCGVVAMCSMIIPGLSGSFVLVLMGNYKLIMLDSVSALSGLQLGEALPILIPVGIGAVVGLIVLSRVLNWLFKNYHNEAVGLITGFVLGSLAVIWPWKEELPKRDLEGLVVVKTAERTLESRPGTLAQVKENLSEDEEIIVAGYGNWSLPQLDRAADWAAFAAMVAGALLIVGVEWSARRGGQLPLPDPPQ